MVLVDVASAHMPCNARATPSSLDDANRHIRMLRPQLHGELLSQIAQMLGVLGIGVQPCVGVRIDAAEREILGSNGVGSNHKTHMLINERFRQIGLRHQTIAKIVGIAGSLVILRMIQLHIRLAGRNEHVTHIHVRQLGHRFAGIL